MAHDGPPGWPLYPGPHHGFHTFEKPYKGFHLPLEQNPILATPQWPYVTWTLASPVFPISFLTSATACSPLPLPSPSR